tara:strand:+ start:271 stop:474 length:204 start_codon:yes stop_codon:yes gene_type:complete
MQLKLLATILELMGIDHTRLSFRFQGLDFRLTGVEPHHPVKKLIAYNVTILAIDSHFSARWYSFFRS